MPTSPLPDLRRRTVKTRDGVSLTVVEAGDPAGEPVVLLHGVASSWRAWEGVLADRRLAERYRLVALDLRGHGSAPDELDPARLAAGDPASGPAAGAQPWLSDLDAALEGLDAPHLVGWSFGATVVQAWLTARGGLDGVRTVTLACCPDVLGPVPPDDPAAGLVTAEAVAALVGSTRGGEHVFAQRVLTGPGVAETPPGLGELVEADAVSALSAASDAALGYAFDSRSFLAALPDEQRERITAVVAGADQIFDAAVMRTIWEQAGVRTLSVSGQPHAFPLVHPTLFASLLLGLLSAEGASAATGTPAR